MKIEPLDIFSFKTNKERKGFFFRAGAKSSNESAIRLCDVLIHHGITQEKPETIYMGDNGLSVFVYGDDFDMPSFFRGAEMAMQIGICQIGSIQELTGLKDLNLFKMDE